MILKNLPLIKPPDVYLASHVLLFKNTSPYACTKTHQNGNAQ